VSERSKRIASYFRQCLSRLEPLPVGVQLVNQFEYLLAATVEGSPEGCNELRSRLQQNQCGELVPDATFSSLD
jgi:hypothetical protein